MKINECSKSAIKQFEHIKKISLVDTNDELGHIELFIFPINRKILIIVQLASVYYPLFQNSHYLHIRRRYMLKAP